METIKLFARDQSIKIVLRRIIGWTTFSEHGEELRLYIDGLPEPLFLWYGRDYHMRDREEAKLDKAIANCKD